MACCWPQCEWEGCVHCGRSYALVTPLYNTSVTCFFTIQYTLNTQGWKWGKGTPFPPSISLPSLCISSLSWGPFPQIYLEGHGSNHGSNVSSQVASVTACPTKFLVLSWLRIMHHVTVLFAEKFSETELW